jgi:hypothetical protein
MTGVAFQAGVVTEDGTLADNAATSIFTATGATYIRVIAAEKNAAGSHTVTVDKYNGSAAKVVRFTAALPLTYDTPFLLPPGWSIRLTSSDASGKIDWSITYDPPAAARIR